MNIWDIAILTGMAVMLAAALYHIIGSRKKGTGCGYGCESCSGCSRSEKGYGG